LKVYISYDTEILPYDELALKKAQKLFRMHDNEINEDIDFNFDELTILETESTISKLTEEEIDYLVENNSDLLTSCVIIDIIDGELQCCSKTAARPLTQLIGTWEIEVDEKIFTSKKKENKLHTLGVCSSHFNFDQNKLHTTNLKQLRSVDRSWIYFRRCLYCNKSKYFFSRGNNCIEHSVCIIGRNIQVPCLGLKTCPVFK